MKTMKRLLVAAVFIASLSTIGTSNACIGDLCGTRVIFGDCKVTVTYKLQHTVTIEKTGADSGILGICALIGTK